MTEGSAQSPKAVFSATLGALGALSRIRRARSPEGSPVEQRISRLTMPRDALRGLLGPYARVMAEHDTGLGEPSLSVSSLVFAADHEIAVKEPISAYPQAVTRQMLSNFMARGAAHAVLAARRCRSFTLVDVGVARGAGWKQDELPSTQLAAGSARGASCDKVNAFFDVNFADAHVPTLCGLQQTYASGCRDPRFGESLGDAAAKCAFDAGFAAACAVIERDKPQLLVLGEMGIGNTTASAAMAECLLGACDLAGRGTGLSDERVALKQACVRAMKARHQGVLSEADPLHRAAAMYCCLGGFEHAALAGAATASALKGVFVLLDGLIVTAALAPLCQAHAPLSSWVIAGHEGGEPAHGLLLKAFGWEPLLQLSLRLGEGSGALLAAGLLADAHALVREMATFEEAQVSGS